jgi:hypothetical protein
VTLGLPSWPTTLQALCLGREPKVRVATDDVNDEVPNETPKILIPFNGVVNWDKVLKLGGRPKVDHATHF